MKILVDENIPLSTVVALQESGHEVLDVRGTEREGACDEHLWQLAQNEKRLLISAYIGFKGKRFQKHCGILIIQLKQPSCQKIHERILGEMQQFSADEWPNSLLVVRDESQSLFCS